MLKLALFSYKIEVVRGLNGQFYLSSALSEFKKPHCFNKERRYLLIFLIFFVIGLAVFYKSPSPFFRASFPRLYVVE